MSSYSSFSSSISGSASSSPSLSFRSHVSSQSDSERVGEEMDIIKTWFSVLNDEERTAALTSIAELPCLREIEPLIQTLKDRKRDLWRRQEDLLIQPGTKPKWPMPAFPHNSQDPRWVAKWLRALRLHKYENCLTGMSPAQVSRLSDADLQQLGVDTVGARTKLLRAISSG
ncbi:uncharacterized protein NECHADRAFT_100005 [Fusarium vanettenii 77-13-4]|uniref:SAM domain-containing protein n=1 Tax=Fusarium vanettenii (strain ATCC MYA-4622 / CBS 123669 / FGSC 9596 / NRRL 45880 / 77-13-4) TaxID=660122 RepID=C7YPW7_FUSV7|nr:uncharacterized protein NECHADRAFT_100005 [Fusarium vanettenii 77-13-4]EEU45922.1 hypothetical protein NECHADRAFT_100005 [Fusarium vanettenii 77-13-4]